ncbi:hypothetical protein EUX98_g1737 [Antrodiella citrinella]|uniref:Uncharacterized protein n=1 Tax=Antrodiella citrinella TaxID=2447956 RepID=A0A4S4N283_9APHY|nr:hypothetical protein EUX98_g1737 [Antrodiella citrinella]
MSVSLGNQHILVPDDLLEAAASVVQDHFPPTSEIDRNYLDPSDDPSAYVDYFPMAHYKYSDFVARTYLSTKARATTAQVRAVQ